MSILNLKGGNAVNSIVNAIVNGYRDDIILDELAKGVESEELSTAQFKSAIDALQLYVARFAESVKSVTDAMKQFEFNEKSSIIKNRPLNLAEQVMQDVDGFNQAAETFYDDDEDTTEAATEDATEDVKQVNADVKSADIKKPPVAPAPQKIEKVVEKQLQQKIEKQNDK